MQASPRVTVVIAAYNAGAFIDETLQSVFVQSLKNFELIVVDDGSIDRTPEILNSYSDPRLIVRRQANSGVSAARNAGLALARAPYVFFLDADDILEPTALAKMVDVLERMPDRVACFGHHIKIAEDGSELSNRGDLCWKTFPTSDTLRHLIAKNFIVCGAICIRTEAALAVRGFNTSLKLGEDWEFWCRLAALGDFAALPNDVILFYRQRFGSANYKLRPSALRPNFHYIDAIYSDPKIRRRFSWIELAYRRRLAEIDAFWAGARNEYFQGRMIQFLKYMVIGTVRYPDSMLRPRLVYLFLHGLKTRLARTA